MKQLVKNKHNKSGMCLQMTFNSSTDATNNRRMKPMKNPDHMNKIQFIADTGASEHMVNTHLILDNFEKETIVMYKVRTNDEAQI